MHLQHDSALERVTVHRESWGRRVGLTVTLGLLYVSSMYACYATSGKPYARSLEQGRLLDVAGEQKLQDKAAQHAALQQRKKAEKLATTVAELRTDEEPEDEGDASENKEDKPKKKSEARKKAELALERAAQLAEAMVQVAKRGENKTEDEVKAELFG